MIKMRKRINLTIAPETAEALESLSREMSVSRSAVMDRAVAALMKTRHIHAEMYVRDCMPMVADIVSGHCPRPVELPDGGDVNWYVATQDGDVYWPDVAPAWHKLELGDAANVCLVARQGREPREGFCEFVADAVGQLRAFLGEPGAAVCDRGRVLVFNSDGTRVAVMG